MRWFCLLLFQVYTYTLLAQTLSEFIHVDQFGYLTNAEKVAVISNPQIGYNSGQNFSPSSVLEVRDANNDAVIFSDNISMWKNGAMHTQSGDNGWWFDFSSVTTSGTYYILDVQNDHRSPIFRINENPYADVMTAALKMFYYNRCNSNKEAPYAEANWVDNIDFTNALQDGECRYIYDQGNAALERDLTGGWWDAGDFNKYVTFTYQVIHDLLKAYESNPALFAIDINIPESGDAVPDILDEVKWELDWLLKMINTDGSVIIKMGSRNHNENVSVPPSANTDPRFYGPTCTSASAASASMLAHAAKVFQNEPGMSSYAITLQAEATKAFEYVKDFLDNGIALEENCDDGSIISGDADWETRRQLDAMISAAVHLFELTGDTDYSDFVVSEWPNSEQGANDYWAAYKMPLNDALLLYTSLAGADQSTSTDIINSITASATNDWDNFCGWTDDDLYRGHIPDWAYHWGSNLPKAHFLNFNLLLDEYGINTPDDPIRKAAEQLHYFHGVNPLGMVYLSNMYSLGAERSVNEIYHTWFNDGTIYDHALNSPNGPPPGYMSGGANKDFSIPSISPPSGQPPQKSYLDFNDGYPDNSWEISEPAIYYQAAYIRALANYTNTDMVTSVAHLKLDENCIEIFPNPVNEYFVIQGILGLYTIEIIDVNGTLVESVISDSTTEMINTSSLPPGLFLVRAINDSNGQLFVQKIIKQ